MFPSILGCFSFNTSFLVVSFHSLLESLKSVVVKVSSCHVFYDIKTNPFLSSPSPLNPFFPSTLNLFFPSTLELFFHILLIFMLRPSCLGAQVIFTFQHRSFSSISLDALQTTTEEVFWSERSTAAKLMAPDEVDTIRLWTVTSDGTARSDCGRS